jgi:hypothetical protein
MTREELKTIIDEEISHIQSLFAAKNDGYGGSQDGLYNFRASAKRYFGTEAPEDMYTVLSILRDKHEATLAKNGLNDPHFVERTRDSIVYSLIALAMNRMKR